ncbi:CD4-1 molecule [Sebastes umbrosus]|uniref:CD4-1 molecule n=1 Tax=Sebastes umbrosus TaxID=72105 RepID=UPI00189F9E98|nr:CD4-1 molecule [Sebastes umbrosus]XP_037640810.1 CD4-1 molecule [Sebastes umbrosus]XP_037640811.1 CD4-1 molecule [Sebastes umbrosus]
MKNSIQSVLLLIAVLMSTTGAAEVIYARVNETVSLRPVGNNLNTYLYWFFGRVDGLQLAWSNNLGGKGTSEDPLWKDRLSWSGNSLIIKNIQQQNFGTFFFKQSEPANIIEYKLLKLTVTVNPPSPLLLPGYKLSLSCNAETVQGQNTPVIHWLNPQQVKVANNQGQFTVTSQDTGQWTCVVTHDKKEKKATVSVTVVDLSPAPLHPLYTSKSWPLKVPCSFLAHISWQQITAKGIQEVLWDFVPRSGSSPQRLFNLSLENPLTWKPDQNRGLRPVPDPQKGYLSLTRNRGREDDSGNYQCALKFKNGATLKRTVHVEVLQIISSPGTELISGQQLNLTCSIGHPLPSDLEVKWFPPEQSLLSSLTSDRHPAHLIIPEVGTGGGGKWRCELWRNSTRLTSADITLKIEPKLSVWMLVVICSVTSIVILLLILVFIICRRRQRKTRHPRRQLCQCKTPKPKGFYRT